ncbi:hypothetical protein K3495_g6306 [Podosphaera aphanis]|nr:hypothetical protein K3495_g6306 [Podosphaera aphanis]
MQSGITASQELLTAFKTLVTSPDRRGIICTITEEVVTVLAILEPASSSFPNDLSLITPHIQPNVALFVILRRYELSSTAPFVCITYVPDSAPVRSKMLFASTRLSLVRELGVEKFRDLIFATTREELTPGGFTKHDEHVKLVAPLTDEEKSLGEVKRMEAEEGRGMTERKSHVISGVRMAASDEVMAALQQLAKSEGEENLVQLRINAQSEVVELESYTATAINDVGKTISNAAPRYSFYRYDHTHKGISSSPILFIYTCPSGSKVKERMLYAAFSRSAQLLSEEVGIKIEKKIEESDPSEISEEGVLSDLHPTVEVKKGFERPRRPGANRPGR